MMTAPYSIGFTETPAELTLDSLSVKGNLPSWLTGTLIRNGPGTFRVGDQQYRHWFDGLAMLHKFSFEGSKVSYANKFLDNKSYRAAKETGRISYSEFATDPCRDLFARAMAIFSPQITDSAKVNVARIAGQYMALAETPIQVEFDIETLKTVGVFNYEERIVGQMTTVHPQFDFEQGDTYNVVTHYNALSHYNIYRINAAGRVQRAGAVPVIKPAYLHSFGMSQNYIIIAEFPLVVNSIDLLLWLRPYIENFRWEPHRGTPFTIINRHTGEMIGRFEGDPFFAFHHVNAFERGDELYVDLVAYDDASIIQHYYLNRLNDANIELPFGKLRRYQVPLKQKRARIRSEELSDACMELPRFDYARYNMDGAYRFVYASSIDPAHRTGFYNQIVKADLVNHSHKTWTQAGCYPGEPVFVGRPDRRSEDDGVVLSVVLDTIKGNSFLLALDAHTFDEIARAEVPQPILFGYHGEYFPPPNRKPGEGRLETDRMKNMITVTDVYKSYTAGDRQIPVLRGVSFDIAAGEFVAIVGPSGNGKTTLLNMITGIDHPTRGSVIVNQKRLDTLSEDKLAQWRGTDLGIVFQFFQLLPALSLLQNIILPMDFVKSLPPKQRRERALHLLDQVGLADQAHKLPSEVSGGQQQRAAIARALANNPPLIVADEPTGNLDAKTSAEVFDLFAHLVDQGKTLVMVTHNTDLARKASRVLEVVNGKIVRDAAPQKVIA